MVREEPRVRFGVDCTTGLKKLGLPEIGFEADCDNVDGVCGITLVLGVRKKGNPSATELPAVVPVWNAVSKSVAGFGVTTEGESVMTWFLVGASCWEESEREEGVVVDGRDVTQTLSCGKGELKPTSISCPILRMIIVTITP